MILDFIVAKDHTPPIESVSVCGEKMGTPGQCDVQLKAEAVGKGRN